jgi:hypothetical protein
MTWRSTLHQRRSRALEKVGLRGWFPEFARWRFWQAGDLEFVAHLKPGGTLAFLNFSDDPGRENQVESSAKHDAVLLHETLEAVVRLRGEECDAPHVKPPEAATRATRTP